MSNNPTKKRILLLGGGFAGLYAVMELEKVLVRRPEVEITLVNRENFFLFTPMLHEVAASELLRRRSRSNRSFSERSGCLSRIRSPPALTYIRSPGDRSRLRYKPL